VIIRFIRIFESQLGGYISKKKLNFLAPISLRQEMSQDSKINNILVAVDGSENSIKAADYAIKLALGLHGRVIALYVILPPGKQTPDKILTRGTQGEYDFLDKLGQKYKSADVKLEIDVVTSDSVIREITDYAEKK
jgi:nucleotide-binding universal stress UspA family protein